MEGLWNLRTALRRAFLSRRLLLKQVINDRPRKTIGLFGFGAVFQPRFAVLQWGTALGEGTSGFQGLGIAWFIFLGSDRSFDKSLYVA